MLQSKKGMNAQVKMLQVFSDVAKPLLAKSRTDSTAKEALAALDTGREMIEAAIRVADVVFVEREDAAAKRQAAKPMNIDPKKKATGKTG